MKTKVRLKKKILKTLGQRVKAYRTAKGISQEALAFEIGADRTDIGAIEQGTRSPSIYFLFVLANALDVELKDLVDITVE